MTGRLNGPALLCAALLLCPCALAAQQTAGITLQPGDVVSVEIWREPDLSGAFQVDESGAVVLPLLGRREVAGVAFATVRDGLITEYREQLRNPSIQIVPLRRVNVLGEVRAPGLYTVDPTVTLAGAIALAGGTTPNGDLERIRVIRDGREIMDRVSAHTPLQSADIRSGDQIVVDRRNWFERNSTFVVSALLSVTSIIITLSR